MLSIIKVLFIKCDKTVNQGYDSEPEKPVVKRHCIEALKEPIKHAISFDLFV